MNAGQPNPHLVEDVSNSDRYEAEDRNDDECFIAGKVQFGILTFTVVAIDDQGQRGPGNISGTDFFEAMWNHLGTKVQVIETDWSTGSGMTTNIDELNRLTSQAGGGRTIDEGSKRTWTGRRAASKGFTDVTVVRALPPNTPGRYQEVVIRFRRP
jgi:hypothetical protein